MAMNFDTNVVVNTGKTLTVNGKEVITDEFSGATSSANGSKGYVPAPSSSDRTKFLKADGTWAVPPVPPNMAGATASTAGLAGLVPAPAAGDQEKVLHGDGTWKNSSAGTFRVVPFSVGVSSWTLSESMYSCTFQTEYVTATSIEFVEYSPSFRTALLGDIYATKASGGGGITFTTNIMPVGTLEGVIKVFDSNDGKISLVTQLTALPTLREVPFTLAVSDWTLNDDMYEAVFTTPFVTITSHDFVEFDESVENASAGIKVIKANVAGSIVGIKFISRSIPSGSISGIITPLDNADGKVAIALQDTVVPIVNGGTGSNTLQGAQDNLGITGLINQLSYEERSDRFTIYGSRVKSVSYKTYRKYENGFVIIYIKGVTNTINQSELSLFTVSGTNPRLGGYLVYGGASILNAQLTLENGTYFINKIAGAISANIEFNLCLYGFEGLG